MNEKAINSPNKLSAIPDAWNADSEKPDVSLRILSASGHVGHDLQSEPVVPCRILIVDSDAESRREINNVLNDLQHELLEVETTEEALEVLAEEGNKVDLILVDLNTPEIGGIAFSELVRKNEATRLIPVFIQATPDAGEAESHAFSAGADEFLIAPLKPAALRARVQATLRLKSMMESLDDSESVLLSLAKSVEDRDPDLGQHCQRLALMASAMGLALGLPASAIRALQRGGYLHDIGKIGIPDRVLFKSGPLTESEWEIMRSHVERGERICACMKSMAPVSPIIRHHHEKFDGTGYPDGLKGEEIPLLARILQTVDIYDALTTERPYKRAYTPEEAMTIMREESERGWRDPVLLNLFSELLPLFRNPALTDPSQASLQALSEALNKYRKKSLRSPESPARNFKL